VIEALRASHDAFLPGASEPSALRALRDAALARFQAIGLPDKKLESWRYSSTARLARAGFVHDAGPLFEALAAAVVNAHALPGAAAEIVIVNGEIALGLSRLGDLPPGVTVSTIRDAVAGAEPALLGRLDPARWPARPDASRPPLAAGQVAADRGFDLLNTAFLQGGVLIRVAPGVALDAPIHVLSVVIADGAPVAAHARLLVTVGRSASATIVERHVGGGASPSLVNVVTDLELGDGASAVHHLWRLGGGAASHVGLVRAEVGPNARLETHAAIVGGDWVRADLDVRFTGAGAEALATGVALVGGSRHADTHTWLRHDAPHCTSRQLFRAVAGGQARAVFDGCIAIAEGARRTQAELSSRNLLLSERAAVFARPQLEISNDDVVASHGCTIGQLDPEQVAYLRSRGLPEPTARAALTRAFVVDHLGEIADPALREAARAHVEAALATLVPGGSGSSRAALGEEPR
jgi:Fe-S cluster assembly protein SufD